MSVLQIILYRQYQRFLGQGSRVCIFSLQMLVLPVTVAGVMFQMCVSEDYSYRFYLTPKLSSSSLSYRDLFLDDATDKVGYDCITVIYSAHLAFVK